MAKVQVHVAVQSENNISALYYMKYLIEKNEGKNVSFPSSELAYIYKARLDTLFVDSDHEALLDYCNSTLKNFTRDHEYFVVADFKDDGLATKECQKINKAYKTFMEPEVVAKDGQFFANKKYVQNPLEGLELPEFNPFKSYYVAVIS